MKRVLLRACGLVALALGLSATTASAQDRPGVAPAAPNPWFSLEAAAGPHVHYRGSMQSIAFGFAPTRSLTFLVSAERSHVADKIEYYPDGYSSERGGTERFVSVEVRGTFLARRRVSPYVLGGTGRGTSRLNVSALFPGTKTRDIQVIYYGGGVRIPVKSRLDAFVDARFIMAAEARSDYFGVRMPVRAGLAVRF
jgi:hypothetical protein